jgi:hypothetical protein
MTETPTKEDYDNTVEKCAQDVADKYGPTNESREELRGSRELGEVVLGMIKDTKWIKESMYELAIYHSETDPSVPTHSPMLDHVVDLKSEPNWSELAVEAAHICLESDVIERTIEILMDDTNN